MDADFLALVYIGVLTWACGAWVANWIIKSRERMDGPLSPADCRVIRNTALLWPLVTPLVMFLRWLRRGGRHG